MIAAALPTFDFVNAWTVAMVRASFQGAVAIALVWIVCRCLPRLPAGVRCWLWRLALLKMALAVLPLGSLDVPLLPCAWAERQTAAASAGTESVVAFAAAGDRSFVGTDPPADAGGGDAETSSSADQPFPSSAKGNVAKAGSAPVGLIALFAAWLAVLTAFVGVIAVRVRAARRWRQHWRLIKDRDVLTLGERLAGQYGLFQPPVLFEAEQCESPVVFGAVRTLIVLPSELLAHSTPSQLRLILAHEMAHIRRGDLLGNWFTTLVSGVFFFHPLVWLALRESRLSQEVACDELAVRQPDVSVADYGRLLVELATHRPLPAAPLVTVGVVESFHIFLKRRLSAMKTFGTRSRSAFALSWIVAAVAVLGLLPWRLVAQTEDDEQKPANASAEQKMNVEAKAGKYKVVVDRVRREDNRKIAMVPSGFPPFLGKMQGKGFQHNETKKFAGGQATTSVGGSGMAGGSGGGSGGVFHIPNLILDVGVTGPKTNKNHQLMCAVHGTVKAVDDQGREADAPPSDWMTNELVGVEYRRGPGRTAVHLALAPGDPRPRYLRSVDGELLVAEAIVSQVKFRGDEALPKSKKGGNGLTVRLEKVTQSADGIDVTINTASAAKGRSGGNPMQNMQQMMLANAPGRVKVEIEDSEGNTRSFTGHSSSASDSGNSGSFSGSSSGFSSSGGSFGGSSGGSSGSFGPNGKRSRATADDSTPGDHFHFDPLPEGVTLKAIRCIVTDLVSEPEVIPFHFQDIQLP